MKEVTYRCNKCNAVRQEANHWWVVSITRKGEEDEGDDWRRLEITPWEGTWTNKDDAAEEYEQILHLCGQGCVGQVVAGWMDAQSLPDSLVAAV